MKSLPSLFVVTLGLFSMTLSSQAQTIVSLQFQTNGSALVGANSAGVFLASNYNVDAIPYVSGSGNTLSNLIDSTGVDTGISATISSLGGYDSSNGNSIAAAGDHALMSGYALTNYGAFSGTTLTLTLNNLDATHSYSFIAYLFDNDGTQASVNISGGGPTYFISGATNTLTGFQQATATTLGTASLANYAQFDDLSGSTSLTFNLNPLGGSLLGLNGFQLIDNGVVGAVPEPSTVLLSVLGFLGLAFHLRRRKV